MPDRSSSAIIAALLATTVAVAAVQFWIFKKKKDDTKPGAKIFLDKDTVSQQLCAFVVDAAKKAISERGTFHLAVAGGSLLDALKYLADYKEVVDFSKVTLGFANHKCVDPSSDKATLAKCKVKFADDCGIKNFVAPSASPKADSDGTEEAEYYAQQLLTHVPHEKGYPVFDLILLGLGADGHIGSCHPMSPAVKETIKTVAGSPKEGEPSSITLTIESMNNARQIGVVVCGGAKGKKEAVKRSMHRPAEMPRGTFPAQLLKSPIFFLDTEAADDL